ncbi:Mitochondrial substrate/solute carrier [Kalmanozyma brasiliensis GHG001]|uniref:Mitochondrial carrier protein n=1 Tax=Kalmanozyma brasiliensis (strain GHG001) TaxID=1365824 RepID=V5GU48_KALBG|nr:Mitochondrial substrate/solute carrier [Kalmanozyma brasiliensis GHG001]EST09432.1 Mitochondrial substrate/solute carrier [Kalmanozyma brasiliensis GHG001]
MPAPQAPVEPWPPFALPTVDLVAGSLAGAAQVIVGQPLDTVKVRSQIAPRGTYTGPMDVLTRTIRTEGPLALYKGMASPLLGIAAQNALLFTAFQSAKRFISPESQRLSTAQIAAAGAIAGGVNSVLSSPVELFKIRMQAQISSPGDAAKARKLSAVAREVYSKYGVKNGVMRGFWVTVMREVPAYAGFYTGFELAKSAFRAKLPSGTTQGGTILPIWALMASGSCGGICNWLACYPLDVLKSRIQLNDAKLPRGFGGPLLLKYVSEEARTLWKEQGMKGFWVGLSPTLLRAIPAAAATFTTFEVVKDALERG